MIFVFLAIFLLDEDFHDIYTALVFNPPEEWGWINDAHGKQEAENTIQVGIPFFVFFDSAVASVNYFDGKYVKMFSRKIVKMEIVQRFFTARLLTFSALTMKKGKTLRQIC